MENEDSVKEIFSGLMYIRCAWCNRWVDVKEGNLGSVTHTICKECSEEQVEEYGLRDE
jgi:hypothetical protein